jgi:DNA-binding protein YbaB
MDIKALMRQAQQVQEKMKKVEFDLRIMACTVLQLEE